MAPPEAERARRAVFLDRDGVINRERLDYVKSWGEFVPLPGAYEAIRGLGRAGFAVVVVTNQSAINRGLVAPVVVEEIHRRMLAGVAEAGGRIDAVYVCPHRPDEGCACRKPRAALIERALAELGLARGGSYLIGDAERDLVAGRAAGLSTVLVAVAGDSAPVGVPAGLADLVVGSLAEAARILSAQPPAAIPSTGGGAP
jgi:histidinol-phosphate phosphatase family protein